MTELTAAARHELIALGGIIERNLYLVKRYIWWDLAFLLWTIANTLTIVFISRGVDLSPAARNELATKLLVGAVIWAFLGIIFEIVTETVAWERWEGTIEYTFMAPLSRSTHLFGMGAFAVLYGLIRATILFFTQSSQLLIGVNRGLVVLRVAIQLTELLVQNRQRTPAGRQALLLSLDARHCVRQHANGIFVAPLRLVQHRFVVHHFQAARRILPRLHQIVFRFAQLMQFAVNLCHAQIHIRVVRHQLRQFLINLQRLGIFFFRHQRLAQPALVAQFGRIKLGSLAIRDFRLGEIMRLGVGIPQQVEHRGRR